ncbi:MAG: glycine zipper 2TM domain-containing protein [Hyphomonadaceae bacterium]|nr:glycine zipper 2TM domain-containing protein [Hyphomonadaceae bacterium]
MRGQALIAAATMAAALLGAAQPAAAQYGSYHERHVSNHYQCQQSRNNRTAGGAVIGGILGAVLGSNAAADGHRGDGTALGAVVGAAAGAAIGRSSAQCDRVVQGSYDPYTGQYRRYEDNDPYYRDDSGLEGGPYRESGYGYGDDDYGRDCRMGQIITRDPYGREYHENVMMCRGGDGVWRPRD